MTMAADDAIAAQVDISPISQSIDEIRTYIVYLEAYRYLSIVPVYLSDIIHSSVIHPHKITIDAL